MNGLLTNPMTNKKIDSFKGEYGWLSNMYKHPIVYKGKRYGSTEAAYQAHKSLDVMDHVRFTKMGPYTSKKEGKLLNIRPDWEIYKKVVMYELLVEKFKDRVLRKKLIDTFPSELIEGNWWHDNFWGNCECLNCHGVDGRNVLGKLLMKLRQDMIGEK